MQILISLETVRISIPAELKAQAPHLLAEIWRDEFANQSDFWLEMSEALKSFVEKAKLNPHILVYR